MNNYGKIVSIIGPVVDVHFDTLPDIKNALKVEEKEVVFHHTTFRVLVLAGQDFLQHGLDILWFSEGRCFIIWRYISRSILDYLPSLFGFCQYFGNFFFQCPIGLRTCTTAADWIVLLRWRFHVACRRANTHGPKVLQSRGRVSAI